ncbi:hypothetical protein AB6G21_13350 [Providencia hangzhouensis]|uniref:hypothetical protein n=1 Tax=Providencia hangzhouensis TaxID=3031799 RepID=UPI0034DD6AF1
MKLLPDIDINKINADFFELFKENSTLKIMKMDYDRVKKFTLKKNKKFTSKKIIFTSKAEKESTFIHTTNKVFELKKDSVLLFHCNSNGKWENIPISSSNTSKINNSYPNKFNLTLDENELIVEQKEII